MTLDAYHRVAIEGPVFGKVCGPSHPISQLGWAKPVIPASNPLDHLTVHPVEEQVE